jgi:hypothetical protein
LTPLEHPGEKADLKEVLSYALGGSAPDAFLEHLIRHRHSWDEELWRKLELYAYEMRPELARWLLTVDEHGRLLEERQPVL